MEKINQHRVLFITLGEINDLDDRNLYSDLMKYFVSQGHFVTIVSPVERRQKKATFVLDRENYRIIRPKTLNNQKANKFEKLASILSIDHLIKRAIKKFVNGNVDLLLYSTPPISLTNSISFVKQKYNCRTYLMLKDIFPQNAVDLNLIKKGSFFYNYFRKKEIKLYNLSDNIGGMSQANVDYIIKHNPTININKLEICPNSIEIHENEKVIDKKVLREKYAIPSDAVVFIYGGNLGKPQGIGFLLQILKKFRNNKKAFFIIIGSGTEHYLIEKWLTEETPANVLLKKHLPKLAYNQHVQLSDVGLVFLDKKFTIPNYPSRILSYMEYSKPVLSFTDKNTDIGTNAKKRGYGDWAYSGDLKESCDLINSCLNKSKEELLKIGEEGHRFHKSHYQPINSYSKIMNHEIVNSDIK